MPITEFIVIIGSIAAVGILIMGFVHLCERWFL